MKPFNLEEALAGKPVVTRDGKKVTQLHLFSCQSQYPLCGIIENQCIYQFTEKGKYYINELKPENDYDLFMATETVTKWINIFKVSYSKGYETGYIYDTEKEAKELGKKLNLIATVPITFEI